MAEIACRIETVANDLLQPLDVGKAAVALALPDELALIFDPEHPAGAGPQRDLAQILREGREQLLRHPGGPQQPLALSAIGDDDAGLLDFAHATAPIPRRRC